MRSVRSSAGFTLIEVLVSMLILTIIMGALAAAIITSYNATASSFTRINNSHDRQLVEVYLPRDLLSSNSADVAAMSQLTANPPTGVTGFCPNSKVPPFGISPVTVLQLKWQGTPPSTTSTTFPSLEYFAADYTEITVGSGSLVSHQLVRFACKASAQSGPQATWIWTTMAPDTVVAYGLAAPNPGSPASFPASVACQTIACTGLLTMTLTDVSNNAYEISGEMRSST